jgi:hypothetical protein
MQKYQKKVRNIRHIILNTIKVLFLKNKIVIFNSIGYIFLIINFTIINSNFAIEEQNPTSTKYTIQDNNASDTSIAHIYTETIYEDTKEGLSALIQEKILEKINDERLVGYESSNYMIIEMLLKSEFAKDIFFDWGKGNEIYDRGIASLLCWSSNLYDQKGIMGNIERDEFMKQVIIERFEKQKHLLKIILEEDTRYSITAYSNNFSIPLAFSADTRSLEHILLAMKMRNNKHSNPTSLDIVLTLAAYFNDIKIIGLLRSKTSKQIATEIIDKVLPDSRYFEFSSKDYYYVLNQKAKTNKIPLDIRLQWRPFTKNEKENPLKTFQDRYNYIEKRHNNKTDLLQDIKNCTN